MNDVVVDAGEDPDVVVICVMSNCLSCINYNYVLLVTSSPDD